MDSLPKFEDLDTLHLTSSDRTRSSSDQSGRFGRGAPGGSILWNLSSWEFEAQTAKDAKHTKSSSFRVFLIFRVFRGLKIRSCPRSARENRVRMERGSVERNPGRSRSLDSRPVLVVPAPRSTRNSILACASRAVDEGHDRR